MYVRCYVYAVSPRCDVYFVRSSRGVYVLLQPSGGGVYEDVNVVDVAFGNRPVCSCSDSTSSMTDTSFPSLGSDVEGCSHPESPGSRSPVRMIFAICFMVLKFKNYRRRAFHPHCASVPHNPIVASLSWSERAVLVFELRRFEVIWSLLCLRAGSISSFATRRICRCN